ncbi:MAG: hypothetical protein AAB375_02275 [Patescibacteria group bacterium]
MSGNTRTTILASVVVVLFLALGAWWYFGFSLDFMRFFAAPAYLGPPDRATIVSCSPATQTVQAGALATLTTVKGFEAARWYAPEGSPATGQGFTFSVTYATAGIKKVTVEAERAGSPVYVDSVACTVVVTTPVLDQ